MTARQNIEYQSAQEIRNLAVEMVRLDAELTRARQRLDDAEVDALDERRQQVQTYRSRRMRELWRWRNRQNGPA